MPVGTLGTVKGAGFGDLEGLRYRLLLANTYHLSLRPGDDLIAEAGGLHRFSGWSGGLLTDSGGFQVYSLARLRRVEDDGIRFQSHIDGESLYFTPESVMRIQRNLGADVAMAFDECVPNPCDYDYARAAADRTHRWARACRDAYELAERTTASGDPQVLFGIVQGATYQDLREASARELTDLELPGYAIGGLAVGEDRASRNRCVEWCTAILPEAKPRYLMGVGTPLDIMDAVLRGVDMFDCVLPTRNARNGHIFTSCGTLNMRNTCHSRDFGPLDPECRCAVCSAHTRAYIRHLFVSREMLGPILATHHNLAFYANLMEGARNAISAGTFPAYASSVAARTTTGEEAAR